MPQLPFMLMILAIGLPISVLQIIIWRYSRPGKFFKYIPNLVFLIVGLLCFIKAVYFSTGMEDLAYIIIAFLAIGVMFISLITGVILDIIEKYRNKRI